MKTLITKLSDKIAEIRGKMVKKPASNVNPRLLVHYMVTMTLPEQRAIRDRNKVSWHRAKPRVSEFQKLVSDYLNK
jgi:hypothetical protein